MDEIVTGSGLPLSIIIVGIGNADFKQMEALDGDVNPPYSGRQKKFAERDIVQFVPYREVKGKPDALSKILLHEIP